VHRRGGGRKLERVLGNCVALEHLSHGRPPASPGSGAIGPALSAAPANAAFSGQLWTVSTHSGQCFVSIHLGVDHLPTLPRRKFATLPQLSCGERGFCMLVETRTYAAQRTGIIG
jgi:hypothetical protein